MMKFIPLLFVTSLVLNAQTRIDFPKEYANSITSENLKTHVYTLASDAFEGRRPGELGFKKAAEYVKAFYVNHAIKSPLNNDDYFQEIPSKYLSNNSRKRPLKDCKNVLAFIKGKEKPDEIVIISAHLDHGGTKNGEIFNGADDNASGTASLLEIAKAFKKAIDAGIRPKRSLLFLHTTAEEFSKMGSKYYTEHPIFPLENTVANLNIDMIGRVDEKHKNKSDYIYSIGANTMSTDLQQVSDAISKKYTKLNLDYTLDPLKHPKHFFFRSDHYNFAKHNIPVLFYFSGTHEDYHKYTDTPEKINYEVLTKRTQLIFHTTWEIANRDNRIAKKWIAPFHQIIIASSKKQLAFAGCCIFLVLFSCFIILKIRKKDPQKNLSM